MVLNMWSWRVRSFHNWCRPHHGSAQANPRAPFSRGPGFLWTTHMLRSSFNTSPIVPNSQGNWLWVWKKTQKSVHPILQRLQVQILAMPQPSIAESPREVSLGGNGILSLVNHSNTSQQQASVSSCTWKMVDSSFLCVCYGALCRSARSSLKRRSWLASVPELARVCFHLSWLLAGVWNGRAGSWVVNAQDQIRDRMEQRNPKRSV